MKKPSVAFPLWDSVTSVVMLFFTLKTERETAKFAKNGRKEDPEYELLNRVRRLPAEIPTALSPSA